MTALKAGMVLGNHRYELVSCLGKGGQAQVWEARQGGIGGFSKAVVLKILEFDAKSEKQRSLLLHEARVIAQLQHPNLVSIFDVDEVPPYLYIAMEHVNGYDLEELLTHVAASVGKRYLPWQVALAIFRQVCRGLYHAHTAVDVYDRSLRLIHRDLKPNNLLLGRNGIVKIIDFGIAKSTANTHKTQTGIIRGTPAYMSPEQIQSRELDTRSDLYSLGVILYEICAGTNPFANPDTFTTMIQVSQLIPPPLREFVPDCPPTLEALLAQLLSKDPEQRPDDARFVYRQIEQILRDCSYPYEQEDVADWLLLFHHSPALAFSQFGFSTNPRQTILDPGASGPLVNPSFAVQEEHTTTTSNTVLPKMAEVEESLGQEQALFVEPSQGEFAGQTITTQALQSAEPEDKKNSSIDIFSQKTSSSSRPRPPMLTMPDFPRQTAISLPAHSSETSEIDSLLSSLFPSKMESGLDDLLASVSSSLKKAEEPSTSTPSAAPSSSKPLTPPPNSSSLGVSSEPSLAVSRPSSMPPPPPKAPSIASKAPPVFSAKVPPPAPMLPSQDTKGQGRIPPKAPELSSRVSKGTDTSFKESNPSQLPPFAHTQPSELSSFSLSEEERHPEDAFVTERHAGAVQSEGEHHEDVQEKPKQVQIERRKTLSLGGESADSSLAATHMNITAMQDSPRDTIEQSEFFKLTMEIGPKPPALVERGQELSVAPTDAQLNAATFTNLPSMSAVSSGSVSVVQNKRTSQRTEPEVPSRSEDDLLALDEMDLVTATGGSRISKEPSENAQTQPVIAEKVVVEDALEETPHTQEEASLSTKEDTTAEEEQSAFDAQDESPAFYRETIEDVESPLRFQGIELHGGDANSPQATAKSYVGYESEVLPFETEGGEDKTKKRGRGVFWAAVLLLSLVVFVGIWLFVGER